VGGIATFNHQLATGLAGCGHDVTVITETDDAGSEPCPYVSEGVAVHPVRSRRIWWRENRAGWNLLFRSLAFAAAAARTIRCLHRTTPFDLVEGQDAHSPLLFIQRAMRIPTVSRLHTPASMTWALNENPIDGGVRLIECIERIGLMGSSALVSVSRSLAGKIAAWLQAPLRSVHVIHNAVDLDRHSPAPGKQSPAPLLLFAGRLEPRKGPDALLECAPAILARHPDARFRFVGADAGMRNKLERRISELAVDHAVELYGAVDPHRMIEHFRDAWACVLPSRVWENFSMVGLEALACGCPVVATAVGGFQEMLVDGKSGFLVPPGDLRRLTEVLLSIIDSAEMRCAMSIAARARAEVSFGQSRLVEETVSLYRAVMSCSHA
jgi:glycogen synthase